MLTPIFGSGMLKPNSKCAWTARAGAFLLLSLLVFVYKVLCYFFFFFFSTRFGVPIRIVCLKACVFAPPLVQKYPKESPNVLRLRGKVLFCFDSFIFPCTKFFAFSLFSHLAAIRPVSKLRLKIILLPCFAPCRCEVRRCQSVLTVMTRRRR